MRRTLFVLLVLTSTPARAAVICEGWYQEPGSPLERSVMTVVGETPSNTKYAASHKGYEFRVDWNKPLTTFYVSIETNGSRILFTTARVPSPDHPENFTDLQLTSGLRLSISCELK